MGLAMIRGQKISTYELPLSLALMILQSQNPLRPCLREGTLGIAQASRYVVEPNAQKDFSLTSLAWDLRSTNRRWRYDDFNKSGRHVIDEAGDKPVGRQCRNRPERSDVDCNRGARIGDRFGLKFWEN